MYNPWACQVFFFSNDIRYVRLAHRLHDSLHPPRRLGRVQPERERGLIWLGLMMYVTTIITDYTWTDSVAYTVLTLIAAYLIFTTIGCP